MQEGVRLHTVWLEERSKIASFHRVEGYQQRAFICHEFFMAFLQGLQEQGYRFQ